MGKRGKKTSSDKSDAETVRSAQALFAVVGWLTSKALRHGPRWAFIGFVISIAWVTIYRFVPPPTTYLIVSEAMRGKPISRNWVALERVSPNLVNAVIAAEDSKFCSHWGFDRNAIASAMENNKNGGRTRGGSTISQQTAKNAFLWPSRSWVRKGLEAYFTVWMELFWPKQRIMEVYLNIAEFGPGVFGAEAAAQTYFGKPASRLTAWESARLAAVLPAPRKLKVKSAGGYVRSRTGVLVRRARVVAADRLSACALK